MKVQRTDAGKRFPLPKYESAGASGLDLIAAIETPVHLGPLERSIIPTGLMVAIEDGFEGQVRPRSGNAAKRGLGVLNAPGTIDADYRGEIKVILVNLSNETQTVQSGDRIAQLVIAPVVQVELEEVTSLDETIRGSGGLGSTGTTVLGVVGHG